MPIVILPFRILRSALFTPSNRCCSNLRCLPERFGSPNEARDLLFHPRSRTALAVFTAAAPLPNCRSKYDAVAESTATQFACRMK